MKAVFASLLACLVMSQCSLVTVPVKAASSIVTTTVKTTGDIVTAPFDAASGRRAKGEDEEESEKSAPKPPRVEVRRAESRYYEPVAPAGVPPHY